MLYTEEVKQNINKAGLQVIEFKNFAWKIHKEWNLLKDILADMVRPIANLISKVVNAIGQMYSVISHVNPETVETLIKKLPPKQRYKLVRKLGENEYQRFFRHRHIYRIRNCC